MLITAIALMAPELIAPAMAQTYYVQEGNGPIQPVYNQDPARLNPTWWSVLCYLRGTQRGVKKNEWGSISGKSAAEVMSELRRQLRNEEEADRGSSYRSKLTCSNYIGPVAVFIGSSRRSTTPDAGYQDQSSGRAAWVAQATDLVTRWKDQVQDAALSAIREAEGGPYDGVGSVLSEYKDQLSRAQERARLLEGLLNNVAAGGNATANQIQLATNDLHASVNWLDSHTSRLNSVVAQGRAQHEREERLAQERAARQREQEALRQRQEAEREAARKRVLDRVRAANQRSAQGQAALHMTLDSLSKEIRTVQQRNAEQKQIREAHAEAAERQREDARALAERARTDEQERIADSVATLEEAATELEAEADDADELARQDREHAEDLRQSTTQSNSSAVGQALSAAIGGVGIGALLEKADQAERDAQSKRERAARLRDVANNLRSQLDP